MLHDENGVMKLTDFGLSAILSQDAKFFSLFSLFFSLFFLLFFFFFSLFFLSLFLTPPLPLKNSYVESKSRSPGNVGHMSPEVIQNEPFNQKADVYGFAILIWEILKGYEWETEVVGQLEEMGLETKNANLRQLVKTV